MDQSRADFQRFLDGMDQAIESKRQELAELEERLESAKVQLSEKEAKELKEDRTYLLLTDDQSEQMGIDSESGGFVSKQKFEEFISRQKQIYEQQIKKFEDELIELELINKNVSNDNEVLRAEMNRLNDDKEKLNAKYNLLYENCKEIESANLELNLRLAHTENESTMQQKLLRRVQQEDEVLMKALNEKLASLENAIRWRDDEIRRLKMENQLTLESLGLKLEPNSPNQTLSSNIDFIETLKERNAQIEMLKNQLIQATKDLEQNASIIESLKNSDSNESKKFQLSEEEKKLVAKCQLLENELEAKDKSLHSVILRNHELEQILPDKIARLIELLVGEFRSKRDDEKSSKEITKYKDYIMESISLLERLLSTQQTVQNLLNNNEKLKSIIKTKETRISKLVSDLNRMDALLKGDPLSNTDQDLDESKVEKKSSTEKKEDPLERVKEDQMDTSIEQRQNEKTESDSRTAPPSEIDQSHSETNHEDRQQMETMSKSPRTETPESEGTGQANKALSIDKSDDNLYGLHRRLKQVESENELLELAMKEILLSIRWTDSQCHTILIDCPSLERLCQIIEARYLSSPDERNGTDRQSDSKVLDRGHLFQMIILKSELDLLRGQNEQLRAEIKSLRREHLISLSHSIEKKANDETNCESSANNNKVDLNEVQCQTDLNSKELEERLDECKNCRKLMRLSNHLMQAVVRIETRVSVSDESYMNRLKGLCDLIRLLERDLLVRESQLNDVRQRCHLLNRQKLMIESKLQYLESRIEREENNNNSNRYGDSSKSERQKKEAYVSGRSRQLEVPSVGNARMTISLLQSIIGCLQARLDHKDERLTRMETIITQSQQTGQQTTKLFG